MNIQIKSLTIHNFKGILDLTVNFKSTTEISGRNEAGKSSIFDAFTWLLWGKNSEDIKDFNIKNTKDLTLNKQDHEVTGVFDVNGSEIELKKVYREKWTKKRGEPMPEFTGHETLYYYNDVPCSQNEYQAKVSGMLPESIAKLITNPFAFNSLKWEQKREVLVKIAGNVQDSDISNGNKAFTDLLATVGTKSLKEFRAEISAKKKKIKETLDFIPARIDEAERGKPEPDDFDFISKAIANKQSLIFKIDDAISDKVKAHREASMLVIQKNNDLNRLKIELQNMEAEQKRTANDALNKVNLKISSFERDKTNAINEITRIENKIKALHEKIKQCDAENAELRKKWSEVNAEVITPMAPDATICPSCKQELPAYKIEAIKESYEANFNTDKKKRIASINAQGQQRRDFIISWQNEIAEIQGEIESQKKVVENCDVELLKLQGERNGLTDSIEPHLPSAEIINLRAQICSFELLSAPVIDDAELKQRKQTLQSEVTELNKRLSVKDTIEKTELRLLELHNQERDLSQSLADLERQEFTAAKFEHEKMQTIERIVNDMFKLVTFKMFHQNINGGIEPYCECLVKEVPYADVNTAGKIQGGLDIINTLCGHYNIYAPVWIDNRESCAEIPIMASQIINLIHAPYQDLNIK